MESGYQRGMAVRTEQVRSAVAAALGSGHDDTIIEYVVGVLDDESFEFGNGEGVYEAVGDVLVST